MSLVLRVLSPSDRFPDRHQLEARLSMEGLPVTIEPIPTDREPLLLVHDPEGYEICMITRIPLDGRDSGKRKKERLIARADAGLPATGARRTAAWLSTIRQIVELHPMEDVYREDAWDRLILLRRQIFETARGILHTDLEGFTNPAGRLVVSEYPETATETASAAVWKWGRWRNREVNFASPTEHARFLAGK